MKSRILVSCAWVFSLVSILMLTISVQGQAGVSTGPGRNPTQMDLAHTNAITFTPVSVLYLPIAERDGLGVVIAQVDDGAGAGRINNLDMAIDSTGTAYAAWKDTRTGREDIFFASRSGAGEWSPKEQINDSSTINLKKVALGADGSGNAYAIWDDLRPYDYHNDVYFAYRPAHGAWGPNLKVNEGNGGACCADIAVDSAGNAFALWQGDGIHSSYRPQLGSWGTTLTVTAVSSDTMPLESSLALDEGGNAYAIWIQAKMEDLGGETFYTHYDVMFSYLPAGGVWSTATSVDDVDDNSLPYNKRWKGAPALAVDASGNAFAIWSDTRTGNSDIWFAYRPAGGNWGANLKVNDDVGTASQAYPSIALDGAGNAYAVWSDGRNEQEDIYFAYLPQGGVWGPSIRVHDRDSSINDSWGPQSPRIAVDPNSGVQIVWPDVHNGTRAIFSAYFLWRP